MRTPALLAPLFIIIPTVAAHGFVHEVTIDGKSFIGDVPNAQPSPSIVRQINTVSPVKGSFNPFINCGQSAQLASQVAPANPGSQLTFSWKGGDLSNWPHNIGPMLTYMANCGSTTCDKFNSTNAQWFKIDQVGKVPGDNSTWQQQALMNGAVANVTLPENIAPGNYLIRHEIIALHLATEMGGAEFYPSCSQLTIGGTGTGKPSSSELVSLPGAYNDNDPGIFDPSVFDNNAPYTFPGPPVAQFVLDDSPSSSPSATGAPPKSAGTATPTASSPKVTGTSSSASGGTCRLRAKNTNNNNVRRAMRPHVLSRIMRQLSH